MDKVQPSRNRPANDADDQRGGTDKVNPTVQESVPVYATVGEYHHLDVHAGDKIKPVPENSPEPILPKNPDLGTNRYDEFEPAASEKFRFGINFNTTQVAVDDNALILNTISLEYTTPLFTDLPISVGQTFIPQPEPGVSTNTSDGTDVHMVQYEGIEINVPDSAYTIKAYVTSKYIFNSLQTITVHISSGKVSLFTIPVAAFTASREIIDPVSLQLAYVATSGTKDIIPLHRDIHDLLSEASRAFGRYEAYQIKKLLFTATDQANWLKADTGIFAYYLPDPERDGSYRVTDYGDFLDSTPRFPYMKLLKGGQNLEFDVPVTDRRFFTRVNADEKRWSSPGSIGFAPMAFPGYNFKFAFTIQADVDFFCPTIITGQPSPGIWTKLKVSLSGTFPIYQDNEYTPAYICVHGVFPNSNMTLRDVVPLEVEINNDKFQTYISRIVDAGTERRFVLPLLTELNLSSEVEENQLIVQKDFEVEAYYHNGFPDDKSEYKYR